MRTLLVAVVMLVASCTAGCAGNMPKPAEIVKATSHVAATTQDIEQRAGKLYNALCAERLDSPECVYIAGLLEKVNQGKLVVYDQLAKLIASVGGELVLEDPLPPIPPVAAEKTQ